MFKRLSTFAAHLIFIAILGVIFVPVLTRADEADDLREKIAETQDQDQTNQQRNRRIGTDNFKWSVPKSRLSAINELNLTRKKLLTDISLTQKEAAGDIRPSVRSR